jgi:hypothetical protein
VSARRQGHAAQQLWANLTVQSCLVRPIYGTAWKTGLKEMLSAGYDWMLSVSGSIARILTDGSKS